MKSIIITSVFALALVSCKTQINTEKQAQKPTDVKSPVNNSYFFKNIETTSTFSQVKINSKIDIQTGTFIPTADATIYIENAKKTWINISVAFLNIARGIATPSGIKAYEKMKKTYIESDYTYLNRLLNVNFLNYNAFQNLLLGKTFLPINEKDFTLTQNSGGYTLSSIGNIKLDKSNAQYSLQLNYTTDYKLSRVIIKDINTADYTDIQYNNWQTIENENFPKNVKIILKGQKTGQILIENTKFDFSMMETPFSIPDTYTKKEIK